MTPQEMAAYLETSLNYNLGDFEKSAGYHAREIIAMLKGLAPEERLTDYDRIIMRLVDAARRLQGIHQFSVGLSKDYDGRGPGNDLADCLDELRAIYKPSLPQRETPK